MSGPVLEKHHVRFAIAAFGCLLMAIGCRRNAPTTSSSQGVKPRVVSLVPAASDLLEGMGAADHLVAVSNYDVDPKLSALPKVGDYLTTDWERIAPLLPGLIITQYAQGRTPAGFAQRVQDLGATQLNLHIDRLEDIYAAGMELADAVKEHKKGAAAIGALKEQIESIRHAVAGEVPVPALIVVGPDGSSIAGPGTYLDDLLQAAGGKNVAEEMNTPWPTIDRERLASFQPQVIIQLLASSSPQVQQQAELVWKSLPEVPAVKNGRVVRLSEWYVMEPGYQVGRLTRQFAAILHPDIKLPQSTTNSSTRQSPSGDGVPAH